MKMTMYICLERRYAFNVSFDGQFYTAESVDYPKFSTVSADKYELFDNIEYLLLKIKKSRALEHGSHIKHYREPEPTAFAK